jgi:hypothetical protein
VLYQVAVQRYVPRKDEKNAGRGVALGIHQVKVSHVEGLQVVDDSDAEAAGLALEKRNVLDEALVGLHEDLDFQVLGNDPQKLFGIVEFLLDVFVLNLALDAVEHGGGQLLLSLERLEHLDVGLQQLVVLVVVVDHLVHDAEEVRVETQAEQHPEARKALL